MSESTRMTCFSTSELYQSRTASEVELENFHQAETIEEILEVWRKNRSSNSAETLQQRRMENLSWRMMTATMNTPTSSLTTSNKGNTKAGFFSTGSNKDDEITCETKKTTPQKSFGQSFEDSLDAIRSKTPSGMQKGSLPSSPSSKRLLSDSLRIPHSVSIDAIQSKVPGRMQKGSGLAHLHISPSLPSSPSSKRLLADSLRIPHSVSTTPLSGSPRFGLVRAWASAMALDHTVEEEKEKWCIGEEGSTHSVRPHQGEVLKF